MKPMEFDGEAYKHTYYSPDIRTTAGGCSTLLEMFLKRVKKSSTDKCYGHIKNGNIVWLNNIECLELVCKLSSALKGKTGKNNIFGLFSVNRYEWMIAEHTIYSLGGITCPVYSTFGIDAVEHVLIQTEMEICFMSGQTADFLYENLLASKRMDKNDLSKTTCEIKKIYNLDKNSKSAIKLKRIVVFDDFHYEENYRAMGIKVDYFNDLVERTKVEDPLQYSEQWAGVVKSDDLATICYTSGTSGPPKGVELTHLNFISTVEAFFMGEVNKNAYYKISRREVYISYLPLAHVMERVCVSVVISIGASIGFYSGNIKNIANDYKLIKPSFIVGVPRVFSLFKENIEKTVRKKGILSRTIFSLALKWKYFIQQFGYVDSILDSFVFNKVKVEFGGNVKACLCGAAPLEADVVRFLQATLSCRIFQGYGSTETCAACIVAPIHIKTIDTVGIPFPTNRIKLAPCEEEVYKGKSEIRVKGSNVFRGYYKNEKSTKESFDSKGWFKTGDLGAIKNGLFQIVGRMKEIFKTSQGEYIAPEKIENIIKCVGVDDILVMGRSNERYIVAVVVCLDDHIADEEVLKNLKVCGERAVNDNKLMKYEVPSKYTIIRQPFTSLGDVLTPTLKKRRAILEVYLKKYVEKMYS